MRKTKPLGNCLAIMTEITSELKQTSRTKEALFPMKTFNVTISFGSQRFINSIKHGKFSRIFHYLLHIHISIPTFIHIAILHIFLHARCS